MQRTVLSNIIRIVGIVLFLFILSSIDLPQLGIAVSRINVFSVAISFVLVIVILSLRGLRWYVISDGLGLHLRSTEAIDGLCVAQMASFMLPGALGDLIRVPYLKCRGNPTNSSLMSVLIDSLFAAVFPYLVLAISVIMFLNPTFSFTISMIILVILALCGSYCVYHLLKERLWPWFTEARRIEIEQLGGRGRLLMSVHISINLLGKRRFILGLMLSAGVWFTYTLLAWHLGQSVGINIPWSTMAIASTLASIFSTLPVSIQGVGIRESVFLVVLTSLGTENVIAFSLLLMAMSLTPSIWGFISWQRDPFVKIRSDYLSAAIIEPCTTINDY